MRKSPLAGNMYTKEIAATLSELEEGNSDRDCNSKNNHSNEVEPISSSVQSAASLDFFSTPELLEMTLLSLPPRDILSATRISVRVNSIIAGSSKLQRALFRKADYSPVVGTAVVRPNPLDAFLAMWAFDSQDDKPSPVYEGTLLYVNLFVFGPTDGLPDIGQLRLTGLMVDAINSDLKIQPSLGQMYISRPPINRISVELRSMGAVTKQWEVQVKGGVRVKHLVQFARLVGVGVEFRKGPGWKKVTLQLGDKYEVADKAWE